MLKDVFEAIGFHVAQVRDALPLRAFRFRFPWLLATIGSGTLCALLAGRFEVTLARSLVPAFFLTLVLGLGESGASSPWAGHARRRCVRRGAGTLCWFARAFRREAGTAVLLGVACGTLVGVIVCLRRGNALAGVQHRHQPAAGAVRGVLVWPAYPSGVACVEARPEDCRRAGDACLY